MEMRISTAGLLVVLALLAPLLVELRTVLSWFGVELTVLETIVLAALVVGCLIAWAVLPERDGDGDGSESDISNTNQ